MERKGLSRAFSPVGLAVPDDSHLPFLAVLYHEIGALETKHAGGVKTAFIFRGGGCIDAPLTPCRSDFFLLIVGEQGE